MPILNTTPNRGYQEPHSGNDLFIDVGRLVAALRAIDTDMAAVVAQAVGKADLNSPAFTGTPTAQTAVSGTDTNQLATCAFVRSAIASLIDSSPGALDTLNELAAALGDDPNFSTTVLTAIGLKADASALTSGLAAKANLLSAGTSDNTLDDTDELAYVTGTTQKRGTLAGLVSSIFKTARTIANAQFASATFKLFNAAGTPRALTFNTTALTADRSITMPDANVDLSTFSSSNQTITLGSTVSVAHGLGVVPSIVQFDLICTTAEFGWSVGEITQIPSGILNISGVTPGSYGIGIQKTTTNIVARFPLSIILVPNKTANDGTAAIITPANWRLIVRAFP